MADERVPRRLVRGRGARVVTRREVAPDDVGAVQGLRAMSLLEAAGCGEDGGRRDFQFRFEDADTDDTSSTTSEYTAVSGSGDDGRSVNESESYSPSCILIGSASDSDASLVGSGEGSSLAGDSIPDSVDSQMSKISTAPTTKKVNFIKQGHYGVPLELVTNYFLMNKKSGYHLNQYRVDFEPNEDSTEIKKTLVKVHRDELGPMMFDGHMMYRPDQIPQGCEVLVATLNNIRYKIKSRLVGHVDENDPMFLQFYNIVIRNCLEKLGMEELGRHFYDRHQKVSFEEYGLELWPGYITAIRNHECGTYLCVEVAHKVLRTSTVLDYIKNTLARSKGSNQANDIIKKDLIGQIVMTHYNRKTYRIDDIDFDASPRSLLFGSTSEDKLTYVDYYKNRWNIDIETVNQPMIVSFPKKKDINKKITTNIYLVPSLCNLTGLTDEMRKNFELMRQLSAHLHMNPTARKKRLDEFMARMRKSEGVRKEFERWQIDFSPNYITVKGRSIGGQGEEVYLSNGASVRPDNMGDWTNPLKRSQLFVTKSLLNWILYAPEIERPNTEAFIMGIKQQGRALGVNVENPAEIAYYDGRRDMDPSQIIKPVKNRNGRVDFVFFILPNNNLKRYAAVKKLFVLQHSIPIQCFLAKNIRAKSFNSICSKVMIQVTAKLGGEPWHLKVPAKDLMVLGFDVYHCAERKNESVGALVSTINNNLTRYFSKVSFHKDKSELSSNMCLDTCSCLDAYYSTNGRLPQRIILYRDGVGEGQITFVLNHEIKHIQAAIDSKYDEVGQTKPFFAFVIVTKKINTRALTRCGANYQNPGPGTVIDDVVTLPERYDFFLVSQSVRQGTVSPTNYNVVLDESGMTPDRMQRLTYKMCHLYFNWSGTVAVPAPCQYAHKLAYLTGVALNAPAPERLADLLWYL